MTAPTAIDLLAEVARLGGRLTPKPPDRLRVALREPDLSRLLPAIRERKQDLLMLLQRPDTCPECGGAGWWQTAAGDWRCGTCEPDPRAHRMRGVSLAVLGDRPIATTPPTGDLPMPGSWARTPAGAVAELVLYRADGGEVLMRSLRQPDRLGWYAPETLEWEMDWRQ